MACSKIFSGGIPAELLNDIIQNFRNDFTTLHSCILVIDYYGNIHLLTPWHIGGVGPGGGGGGHDKSPHLRQVVIVESMRKVSLQ